MPEMSGSINLKFKSLHKLGDFDKSAKVTLDNGVIKVIRIHGKVIRAKQEKDEHVQKTKNVKTYKIQNKENNPIISFDKKVIRFKKLKQDGYQIDEFLFRNKGNSDLIIHEIIKDDPAIEIQRFSKIIPPGEFGKIVFSVDTQKMGKRLKSIIIVNSNDKNNCSISLQVSATKKNKIVKDKFVDDETNIGLKKSAVLIKICETSENYILLDVRTKTEFDEGHIKNAINIDFYQTNFNEKIEQLDTDKTYIVYCKSGKRSTLAVEKMKSMKFKKIYNMKIGYTDWINYKKSLRKK